MICYILHYKWFEFLNPEQVFPTTVVPEQIGYTLNRPSGSKTKKQKLVILYSNQRSGSSFMGELFNRNLQAFYVFEPLFPYTPHCEFLNSERIEALERMLDCDFSQNENFFRAALRITNTSTGIQCVQNNVCFVTRSQSLRRLSRQMCLTENKFPTKPCHPVLNHLSISKLCIASDVVAFKVLRVCSLRDIDELYKRLSNQGKELYVVHLVRDPRAIISSKLKLELKKENMISRAKELCQKMERNLKFVDDIREPLELMLNGRYMQIRYEEAATNSIETASRIYRFLGSELPTEVRNWLQLSVLLSGGTELSFSNYVEENHNDVMLKHKRISMLKNMKDPYSTLKDSSITTKKWRRLLPLSTVIKLQEICSGVLKRLNYTMVWKDETLLDFGIKLWN